MRPSCARSRSAAASREHLLPRGGAAIRTLGLPFAAAARRVAPALGLTALFVAVRLLIALTPPLRETYYDEALTGLMASRSSTAPAGLLLGRALRRSDRRRLPGGARVLALRPLDPGPPDGLRGHRRPLGLVAWFIARRAGAGPFAFLAGLLVAVPPVFLSHAQLSTHGESAALAFGTLALASAAYLVDARTSARRGERPGQSSGLASGLSWWSSQIGVMLLVAAALAPRRSAPRVPPPRALRGLALFFAASWPFWVWNMRHEWATFRHLATWGGPLPSWPLRLQDRRGLAAREPSRLLLGLRAAAVRPGLAPELDRAPGRVLAGRPSRSAASRLGWIQRVRRRERPGRSRSTLSRSRSGSPWRPIS